MRSLFFLIIVFTFAIRQPTAHAQSLHQSTLGEWVLQESEDGFTAVHPRLLRSENPRLVAIALDLTLGLFGIHRLYLGTDVKVPVAYTLTFGGGGVLWLVDLALLIGSPNIDSYKDNPHLFMWIPPTPKVN